MGRRSVWGRASSVMLALAASGCELSGVPKAHQPLERAFVAVAEDGDVALIERFLKADPQLVHAVAVRTSYFSPKAALPAAAKAGQLEAVKLLLDRGVPVDATGSDSQGKSEATALALAAEAGHTAIVQLLLERGARAETRDPSGETALHLAARRGEVEAMELLMARGADMNALDSRGSTPLHAAATAWKLPSIAALCAAQADTKTTDVEGHTAAQNAETQLASERQRSGAGRDWVAAGASCVAFLKPGGGCDQLRERVAREGRLSSEQIAAMSNEFACSQGEAHACSLAGRAYDEAKSMPRDTARSRQLFAQGCSKGDAWGCSREGWFYLAGDGVPQDDRHGAQLYAKACELDYAFACGRLGEFYVQGTGVPRDAAQARILLKRACEHSNKDEQACKSLRKLEGGGA